MQIVQKLTFTLNDVTIQPILSKRDHQMKPPDDRRGWNKLYSVTF